MITEGRRVLAWLVALGLGAITWAAPLGRAWAESYKYTDKDGVVHFTDNPYELPEPMRTKVLRRLDRERQEQEKRHQQGLDQEPQVHERLPPPPARVPRSPTPSAAPADAKPKVDPTSSSQRKFWQQKMAAARKLVDSLQDRCDKLRQARNENRRKGLIFATPGARADSHKAADELEECERKLSEAKHLRDVELPERARKAGVPPGWLRD